MNAPRLSRVLLPVLLFLTGCDPSPAIVLTFDAIDAMDESVPCMFVLGDDWAGAVARAQFANITEDDVFSVAMPEGWQQIEVTVAPLLVDNGKPIRLPKSAKEAALHTGFVIATRRVLRTDPPRHLFILARRGW